MLSPSLGRKRTGVSPVFFRKLGVLPRVFLRIARRDPIEHHSSPRETGVGLRDGQETNYAIPTLRQVIRVDDTIEMKQMVKSQLCALPTDPTLREKGPRRDPNAKLRHMTSYRPLYGRPEVVELPPGSSPVAPYLDAANIVRIALQEGCEAVHPGYGFLSENEAFVALCEKNGVKFVGPSSSIIDLFGDKTKAKEAAVKAQIPTLPGSPGLKTVEEAVAFLKAQPMKFPLLLKAAFGGGGRGQAVVEREEDFAKEFEKCSKEAEMSFGRPEVFIERFLAKAMHVEVQVLGDARKCIHLFERDCSVQLRKQKVVEIAPARGMHPELRERITSAAVALCESVGYQNAGTVEFLVEGDLRDKAAGFYFLELNPRIQVEHTITEEITGLDLVQTQFKIAGGMTLADLGLDQKKLSFQGFAIQVRVGLLPGGGGQVQDYKEPVSVRVETAVGPGTVAVTDYDPMIAKLIVWGKDFEHALQAAHEAVNGFKDFIRDTVHTTWVEAQKLHLPPKASTASSAGGTVQVDAPFPAQVTEVKVKAGDVLSAGSVLAVLSAMKMLNEDIVAERPGKVLEVLIQPGQQVNEGAPLFRLEASGDAPAEVAELLPRTVRKTESGTTGYRALPSAWFSSGSPEEQLYETPVLRRSDRAVKLHRSRGKLLVRERIRKIIDQGTDFLEISALAGWEMYGGGVHSGGTVCGIGVVSGREVMFIGTDATIKGGFSLPT
eukprot:g15606.t1